MHLTRQSLSSTFCHLPNLSYFLASKKGDGNDRPIRKMPDAHDTRRGVTGARECAAATPFTPRYADPVQAFWRWRAFPELKGQRLSCLAQDRDGNFLFEAFLFDLTRGL